MRRLRRFLICAALAAWPALCGCSDQSDGKLFKENIFKDTVFDPNAWSASQPQQGPGAVRPAKPEPVAAVGPAAPADSVGGSGNRIWTAQTGNIGSMAYYRYTQPIPVRGYGLVIGLDGRGSARCSRSIAEYLQKELSRLPSRPPEFEKISPRELIESPHTAAVIVRAEISAAATAGTTLDVYVSAASSDVRSLAGGVLITCDLRTFSTTSPLEGRILMRAGGRVFSNPFLKEGASTADSDPRMGRVLGGGVVLEDRPIELISVTPSYAVVRQMMELINTRFGVDPMTADAMSPTNISMRIPAAYRNDRERFLELVRQVPMADQSAAVQVRAKALTDELADLNAPLEETALALEAIGPAVIPIVQPVYVHRQRATSFYAARVGARLNDSLAIEALARHATEPRGPYRKESITELGRAATEHDSARAALVLRDLLSDEDPVIRIRAYEALQPRPDRAIHRYVIGRNNFILDVIDCDGPGLIYARRTQQRRLAVFGEHVRCQMPLFYSHPDRPVTLTDADDQIVIVRKGTTRARLQTPLRIDPEVATLAAKLGNNPIEDDDGSLLGVGVDYAVVLDVLSELCESRTIPAIFRMEQPDLETLLGPQEPTIRPESDEL